MLGILVVLFSCASSGTKKNDEAVSEAQINYRSELSVWLKLPEVSKTLSESSTKIKGGWHAWVGDAALRWEVEVPENDDYEVYLTANVTEAGDGKIITIEAEDQQTDFTIYKTSGPFPGGENFKLKEKMNFERKKLSGKISLKAGKQIITVSTSGIETDEVLLHIRGIELMPISKKEFIAAEEARAINSRASFDWMAETGYGVMFHWTSKTPQQDGTCLPFEEAVNAFDVEKFVDMVDETGAGYVIFPIGHAESYCPAPIKSWEKIHPGQTTQRDLIEELANALNARDIRLICYMNIPLAFKFYRTEEGVTDEVVKTITENFKAILPEIGNRYKEKIAGYWFDTSIRFVPAEEFFNAAKVGNKDRLITRNSFYWQATTPWQDYWAGEVQHPIAPPVNGYMENGICPNLPYHVLLTMEKFSWGVGKGGKIQDPKFTSEELSSYIKSCMENGGAVTVNLGIYQDGTIGEKALEVMKGVKSEIRK